MSSHDFTIAVYLTIFACLGALQIRSHMPTSRVPSFGTVLRWTVATQPRRIGVTIVWVWLGVHFLAR